MERHKDIRFDLAARADSVYEPKRSKEWNIERLTMWSYLAKSGVERVFIGVESGSKQQLKRYGKGTTPEQNIIALRLLSALGIQLRIGFIMFDQMMKGFEDIKENLHFLERTDAVIKPVETAILSFKELFEHLTEDQEFIEKHKMGRPVHSIVSYMLASMEVLMNAPYARMVQIAEKKNDVSLILNEGKPDTNMGRYAILFIDPVVGELSLAAQKWIDSNFSIMYTIKSLYKVARKEEKVVLYNYMVKHRDISHYLLKFLVYKLEENPVIDDTLNDYLLKENYLNAVLAIGDKEKTEGPLRDKVTQYLTNWQGLMAGLVYEIDSDISTGKITDSIDKRLRKSIDSWRSKMGTWELINNFELN